jgi:hypothetical protein
MEYIFILMISNSVFKKIEFNVNFQVDSKECLFTLIEAGPIYAK